MTDWGNDPVVAHKADDWGSDPLVTHAAPTTAADAALHGAERAAIPTAGATAGGAGGAVLGGELGLLGGPLAPITVPAGAIGGGLAGGFGGGALTNWLQEQAAKFVPESMKAKIGQSKAQVAKEERQHPTATFAGELAPSLLAFRPSAAVPLAERGLGAGLGGAFEGGRELLSGDGFDPKKIALAAAAGAAGNKQTRFGKALAKPAEMAARAIHPLVAPTAALTGLTPKAYVNAKIDERAESPEHAADVKLLIANGMNPEAFSEGHIAGGRKNADETKAAKGDSRTGQGITEERNAGLIDMNRAALNLPLKEIGGSLPAGLSGRKAVNYVYKALGKRYDAIVPRLALNVDVRDPTSIFAADHKAILDSIRDPRAKERFRDEANSAIWGRATHQKTLTGSQFRNAVDDLGQKITKYARSTNPDDYDVALALQKTRDQLIESMELSTKARDPKLAKEFRDVNRGYAMYARLRDAVNAHPDTRGRFSATDLLGGIKKQDKSASNNSYATGEAMLEKFGDAAHAVLGGDSPQIAIAKRTNHTTPADLARDILTGGVGGFSLHHSPAAALIGGVAGPVARKALSAGLSHTSDTARGLRRKSLTTPPLTHAQVNDLINRSAAKVIPQTVRAAAPSKRVEDDAQPQ